MQWTEILRALMDNGTSAVVLAIGLVVWVRRANREEGERKALFDRVLHGDGNGQAGLKQIGQKLTDVQAEFREFRDDIDCRVTGVEEAVSEAVKRVRALESR